MTENPAVVDRYLKIIIVSILMVFVMSLISNIYLIYKLQESYKSLLDCKASQKECQACPAQKACKSFDWVNKYVEVVSGDVQWEDCGEGGNICAFWENYQADVPLPTIKIIECEQQGTFVDQNGNFITGLSLGEHTIVGATIRPCDIDITQ